MGVVGDRGKAGVGRMVRREDGIVRIRGWDRPIKERKVCMEGSDGAGGR